MSTVLSAILWAAPFLSQGTAEMYAEHIYKRAVEQRIHPLLVVALTTRESRFRKDTIAGKNYGLMQVRVSKHVHREFLGQERYVLWPRFNIYLGVSMLAYWRGYHRRHCKNDDHPWWSHYQHGKKVNDPKSGLRVKKLFLELKRKFERKGTS